MGKLRVLPSDVANKIAAGEVVGRPASVVKELMENAVDAGATRIDVVVKDSGRTLVQVIDNGSGMSPADALLCFERHATSKIASAEDLEAILSYGFRGEALASIAAVAEVTLRTRREQDDTGTQVSIGAGGTTTSTVAAPEGSNFAVRNLFYNTPARRKFLKSDAVELRHIVEEFTRVAITRPEIAFTLRSGDRDMFVLKPAKSLKFRIQDLLGAGVTGELVDMDIETSLMKVSGYLGRPESARKTQCNQYFFIGGRYFRSAYLHKAVMKAYEELIPEGLTPSYFIFLETDPRAVDVNVHPTKAEIKFEDESVVFQTLYACVKETLGKNSFRASIDFDAAAAPDMPQLGKSFEAYRGAIDTPSKEFDPDYDPFDYGAGTVGEFKAPHPGSYDTGARQDFGRLFEDKPVPSRHTMVLSDKYILTPTPAGLMVVNLSRARERILYERTLEAIDKQEGHVCQAALFPVQIQIGAAGVLTIEEHAELLGRLGFDITPFGTDTVVVSGVPEGYSCEGGKAEMMVRDLLLILSEDSGGLEGVMKSRLAAKFAKLGALNSGPLGSPFEAQQLLDTLFACSNTELTPGGKRISVILPLDEIDRKF